MDRYAALTLLLLAGPAFAKAPPKPEKKEKKSPSLRVRSIDLARRYVLIELTGVSRPPAPNLFTLTDVRGRHFVALNASCDAPFPSPSGVRACELQIPDGYERHKLAKVELHLGGLHSRTIAAPEAEVAAAWAAAEAFLAPPPSPSPRPALNPSPSPKPSPRPSPSPRPKK